MNRHAIVLVLLLILTGCRGNKSSIKIPASVEAARIEREVVKRVDAERLATSERKDRLHTIRVVGLIVLTGGAVTGLLWLQRQRAPISSLNRERQLQLPLGTDHQATPPTRVFDIANPGRTQPTTRHETPNRP
ncbi:MAG: hypothetical protein ABIT37_14300 [Luteolibacter sp.]